MFFEGMEQRINDKSLEAKMDYNYGMDLTWLDASIQGTTPMLMRLTDGLLPRHADKRVDSYKKPEELYLEYIEDINETLKLLMQELKNDSNPIIVISGLEKDKELLDVYSELNKKQKDLATSLENSCIRAYRETLPFEYKFMLYSGNLRENNMHPVNKLLAFTSRWDIRMKYFGKNGYILNKRKK